MPPPVKSALFRARARTYIDSASFLLERDVFLLVNEWTLRASDLPPSPRVFVPPLCTLRSRQTAGRVVRTRSFVRSFKPLSLSPLARPES